MIYQAGYMQVHELTCKVKMISLVVYWVYIQISTKNLNIS